MAKADSATAAFTTAIASALATSISALCLQVYARKAANVTPIASAHACGVFPSTMRKCAYCLALTIARAFARSVCTCLARAVLT